MRNTPPLQRLADEHAALQQELDKREHRVLDALDSGRWPTDEIRRLLDYLRYELLDQAVHEERLLYPLTPDGFADPRIQQLVDDHVALLDLADRLATLIEDEAGDPEQLTSTIAELKERLARHLADEQEVLQPVSETGVGAVRQPFRSHEWFPLTEGRVVDMDRLPRAFAHSAVLDRLARMRPGECVEIASGERLQTLQHLLSRRGMSGTYGWAYLEEGPQRWRAEVSRRN